MMVEKKGEWAYFIVDQAFACRVNRNTLEGEAYVKGGWKPYWGAVDEIWLNGRMVDEAAAMQFASKGSRGK